MLSQQLLDVEHLKSWSGDTTFALYKNVTHDVPYVEISKLVMLKLLTFISVVESQSFSGNKHLLFKARQGGPFGTQSRGRLDKDV